MSAQEETQRSRTGKAVYEALCQVCGGGIHKDAAEACVIARDDEGSSAGKDFWLELHDLAHSSVSFPNKSRSSVEGKPYDVEVRAALTLFHRYRHGGKRKRKHQEEESTSALQIVSNLGLVRSIETPMALARIVCDVLEEICRKAELSHDIRFNSSGIICIITPERAQALRQCKRLPCPFCLRWPKGEKGLWWHQQREHGSEHSVAAASAASERSVLAIVPYKPTSPGSPQPLLQLRKPTPPAKPHEALDCVKNGDLEALTQAVQDGFDPKTELDRNGASPLLWAAGSGHLSIVKYLIEKCGCSTEQGQQGKRSFSGRTALHWAARNGHIHVVVYLVDSCAMDVDAATADGTTAFCWACWQGHLEVMRFLHQADCSVHKSNSFGCNAVLWCAQGEGNIETMRWLQSIGCSMTLVNSNGHGALHKAAQRGQHAICDWLLKFVLQGIDSGDHTDKLAMIGPDSDGCSPSDLAGIEGRVDLALSLAKGEVALARRVFQSETRRTSRILMDEVISSTLVRPANLPNWVMNGIDNASCKAVGGALHIWEPGGGVHRIRSALGLS